MNRYEQYKICKERGHQADQYKGGITNAIQGALTWYTCKHCGTHYTTKSTVEILEQNIPGHKS